MVVVCQRMVDVCVEDMSVNGGCVYAGMVVLLYIKIVICVSAYRTIIHVRLSMRVSNPRADVYSIILNNAF